MIVAAIIVLVYLYLRVLVALYNYGVQPYLPALVPENSTFVSILIPARNEENSIALLIEKLLNQSYTHFEVIVYDDNSQDATARIVKTLSCNDQRIRLIEGGSLPSGWLGKNHACHNLAASAKGDFLLFLDADVIPANNFVSKIVAFAQHKGSSLVSLFPMQQKKSVGEKLVVSLMYDILLSLLPLAFVVKSKRHSFSGANGQCMLFSRSAYEKHHPHWWKKDEPVEDIAIIKLFKKLDEPCVTLLGHSDIACRMYNNGAEAVRGFAKNIFRFFSNSIAFALFHLIVTTFGLAVVFFTGDWNIFSLYLVGVLVLKAVIGRLSGESVLLAWVLIIPRQVAVVVVFFVALYRRIKGGYLWKGRPVSI
jgi:glycosyltransferase involved in cell wall biosynthesis